MGRDSVVLATTQEVTSKGPIQNLGTLYFLVRKSARPRADALREP
jgi:hypothetical protein